MKDHLVRLVGGGTQEKPNKLLQFLFKTTTTYWVNIISPFSLNNYPTYLLTLVILAVNQY